MAITFGGLATGMDTNAIVDALMQIERAPINRLESDKAFYNNRLKAFSELENKLKSFREAAEAIDSANELSSASIESSSDAYVSATADSGAAVGSYQVTVEALAQQQKDVSQGYASKSSASFGTGTLNLTVGVDVHPITIDSENNSLEGIAEAINIADVGVSATIINDGTGTPYRLVLTGESVADSFSLDGSGLTGGTDANPAMSNTQLAQQAHVVIDGIDIYSDSNNVTDAIPGLSLELLTADNTVKTTLNVSQDNAATEEKIKEFVDAYNSIINFIESQKSADWGNDSSFRSVKRRMQDLLVTPLSGVGSYSTLSQLGVETQRDGTITLSSTKLTDAMAEDYDSVVGLFAGAGGVDGIAAQFASYLEDMTDSVDGIYASRKKSTSSTVSRIDQRIEILELRMEQRENTLRSKFSAMEELVSSLNAQSSFLLQQMANMPKIGNN